MKRILPAENGEIYIVIERDNPMPIERIKDLNKTWKDEDVIITISKLIKGKNKNIKKVRLEENIKTEDKQTGEEEWDKDEDLGKGYESPFGEGQY